MSKKKILKYKVKDGDSLVVCDLIASKIELSKEKIKKAMMNGSCWLKKQHKKGNNRIRKAKTPVRVGDTVEFFYDPDIIFPETEGFHEIYTSGDFGVWNKIPGMLSQGTKYGDAGSVLKEVAKVKKESFLVHRLDKEVGGLIVVAYSHKAASRLSELFRTDSVEKFYLCWVKGHAPEKGTIEKELDDKKAKTSFELLEVKGDFSKLRVRIYTGRTHQIRRHLDSIGHPVIGDPRYGRGNKDDRGLQLVSHQLTFENPFKKKLLDITLDENVVSSYLSI